MWTLANATCSRRVQLADEANKQQVPREQRKEAAQNTLRTELYQQQGITSKSHQRAEGQGVSGRQTK